jgi:hypothetical protein
MRETIYEYRKSFKSSQKIGSVLDNCYSITLLSNRSWNSVCSPNVFIDQEFITREEGLPEKI